MSKNSSARYYQANQERLLKKPMKDIKVFLRKRKKKSNNMVVKDTKISRKRKCNNKTNIK